MYQNKTINQWVTHVKDNFLNSNLKYNLNLNNFDFNMNNLLKRDYQNNFVINLKNSIGFQNLNEYCKIKTLYIDQYPVIVVNIHPNIVEGDSYNIIINPRDNNNNCVYAC